jgi:hypothetical protein
MYSSTLLFEYSAYDNRFGHHFKPNEDTLIEVALNERKLLWGNAAV